MKLISSRGGVVATAILLTLSMTWTCLATQAASEAGPQSLADLKETATPGGRFRPLSGRPRPNELRPAACRTRAGAFGG